MSADHHDPLLRISHRLRDIVPVPGVEGYGRWQTFEWVNDGVTQHGARLLADRAPWHGLFAALDDVGRALSPSPVSILDEANAIVAACWRYGSYVHALTGGELYPRFRKDPSLSRIDDSEMQRINLEFSSALASW